jgi:hypothetical protein
MYLQYHFGRLDHVAFEQAAKVRSLIRDLDRVVRILDGEIAAEEKRSGVTDAFNAAYPVLARMMTARRDNLKETIAALERRLAPEAVAIG